MLQLILRALLVILLFSSALLIGNAQMEPAATLPVVAGASSATDGSVTTSVVEDMRRELSEHRRLLEEQRAEIDRLRAELAAFARSINSPNPKVAPTPAETALARTAVTVSEAPQQTIEDRVKRLESRTVDLGAIRFSGDIRLRYESISGLLDGIPNVTNPLLTGNKLPAQNHAQVRARLQLRGAVTEGFDWGIRLATGDFADAISTNQTLTNFYSRKPFSLDQAYVTYYPRRVAGLRLQGGKFDPPWVFTEMTIDNDLMVEGFNQSYSRTFKHSRMRDLTFVAWQLPLLERNPTVTLSTTGETRRSGRDLALYGGQVRTLINLSKGVTARLSASDLYFSGTQFITPIKVFGDQIQFPTTITLPATMTMPAQTVAGIVRIPRALLVSGGGLGLSTASNNAINGDGRLSSGYNLVDLIARVDLTQSRRFPMFLLFNFVTNTQTRDVVSTGLNGAPTIQRNNERNGYFVQYQAGQVRTNGDVALGYTFMRIEKDAVLTPFNFSDVTQQSDIRAHRAVFAYTVNPRVTFTATGIITKRVNGFAGPFGMAQPGSPNHSSFRLQFDTLFRF